MYLLDSDGMQQCKNYSEEFNPSLPKGESPEAEILFLSGFQSNCYNNKFKK